MLEQIESLWAITFTSQADGHRCTGPVFTNQADADRICRDKEYGCDQKVVQQSLWRDTKTGRFYKAVLTEVDVDSIVHRESALAKLTPEERRALGF